MTIKNESATAPSKIYYNAAANTSHTEFSQVIAIIGAGPAGIRCAQEILQRRPDANICIYSNEPYQPYNRVQLSSLLAGETTVDAITTTLPDKSEYPNFDFRIATIKNIDPIQRILTDNLGNEFSFDRLIIATGARAHQPNIAGNQLKGVYTFRSLKDTEHLYSRISSARHVVVIGGGLLGIEAARALLRHQTKVTLIQQGDILMNRQLDDTAAKKLQSKLESLGITVITNNGVRIIHGENRVEKVTLRDKQEIDCDTVLLCAGIKPNMELARDSKINTVKGIVVDDQLQTNFPHIFAVGECCEHRGSTYGLVNPGFEQAAVCADNLTGGDSRYTGSSTVSRLKVIGQPLFSMGEINSIRPGGKLKEYCYHDRKTNTYRKIYLHNRRLIGIVAYGEWAETAQIQEAFNTQRTIYPWQLLRFKLSGNLFGQISENNNVADWPLNAIICHCNNLSHQNILKTIDEGANTVEAIGNKNQAGTVCGTCKPLLSQLVNSEVIIDKPRLSLATATLSLISLAIVLVIAFYPALQTSYSVQSIPFLESIWNDKFYKQVTGFSILGATVLGLLMSLRKRIKRFKLGKYDYWRLLHVTLGFATVLLLVLHTGLHLGENLNQVLILTFLSTAIMGVAVGLLHANQHLIPVSIFNRLKKASFWGHLLISWPLPILIGVHIFSVYYY